MERTTEIITTPAPSAPVPKLLLTAKDAAFALSVSVSTLGKLTASKQIPFIRLGSSVRYSPIALQEWIEENTGKAIQI